MDLYTMNCEYVHYILFLLLLVFIVTFSSVNSFGRDGASSDFENYKKRREAILTKEKLEFLGGNSTFSDKENLADRVILGLKSTELSEGYRNESEFLPRQRFLKIKEKIKESEVFKVINKLPKGSSLHTHMLAGVNVDFIIKNITYRDNLYGGFINETFKLHFFSEGSQDNRCEWKKLSDLRQGNKTKFDDWLKKQFLLDVNFENSTEQAWVVFKKIFNTGYEMFSYRPVFEDTIFQLLKELHEDNVFYTELRGTIMPLYELDGTVCNSSDFFEIFQATVNKFKSQYSDFIGARYIHSLYRGVDRTVLKNDLNNIVSLKKAYPNLIAGFDFVGHEEEGHTLFYYSDLLLESQKDLNFFFHAGETPWFGHTDLNVLDAVLLNSKRIGHGYAITKHPEVLQLALEKKIALEICPVSNQVLLLLDDPRSHPAATLFAMGYPLVVCNDDPSIWGATGLSYDWYVAFMSMTPRDSGIGVLKALAVNSIQYSSMDEEEKQQAYNLWLKKWDVFLDVVIQLYK